MVYWDPFSPKVNGALWTAGAFSRLAARCAPGATLFTYSTATATRSALLLAGFAVGHGDASGPKAETTAAALPPALPARPLDARWLVRLARSSAPFPPDAPADALERISGHAAVPVGQHVRIAFVPSGRLPPGAGQPSGSPSFRRSSAAGRGTPLSASLVLGARAYGG